MRSAKAKVKQAPPLKLAYTDNKGRRKRAVLKARIVGPTQKQIAEATQDEDPNIPISRSEEDEFIKMLRGRSGLLIEPPFNLKKLAGLREISTELGQAIDSVVTNTVGFGWRLRPRRMPEDQLQRHGKAIESEYHRLTAMLDTVHPVESLTMLLDKAKHDKHDVGNGYLELIDDNGGKLVGINHVHGHTVRLTVKDEKPTKVLVPRVRPDLNFQVEEVPMWHRFRRFVQLHTDKLIWFKEAGDPRHLDAKTGEYKDALQFGRRATSLLHFRVYNALSPYGVPRYIGNTFSIFGSRAAEEANYTTLKNHGVPSMFVIVENGVLTEGSIQRLTEYTETQLQGDANFSKFIVLEGEASEEGAPVTERFRIRIEPLKATQHTDELFQSYDQNNRDKIRQAFRLPPIFVGRCHSEDTEYLTKRGWRRYDEIQDGEEVATMNAVNGAIEYQKPTARHSHDFEGELLHLQNRGIDALLTPNHRMWARPTVAKSRAEKPWQFVEAGALGLLRGGNGGHLELPVSASWEGEELEFFTIPRNDGSNAWTPDKPTKNRTRDEKRYHARSAYDVPGDAFLRFLGYFVAEGSTTDTPGPITLSQNAGATADDMIATIESIGFDPTVCEGRAGQLNISFSHVGLWSWLRENCGCTSYSKHLPAWVLEVSQNQLEILLDAMVDGDGNLPRLGSVGSFSYSTISKALNDQLHIICLKLGMALTSRHVTREEEGWADIWCSYGHYDKRHLLHPKKHIKPRFYQGKVSCFTVPNGLLVTRRNGRVLISGNSDDYTRATADTSRDIADEQVFAPERNSDDHLINRFVLARWDARYHTLRHNHPNITDDIELIRLMGIAEKSGAMTPRRADRIIRDVFQDDIGPMPTGIDLDKPFSITFAEAQQGMTGGGEGEPAEAADTAEKMITGLLDLRGRIERELDDRFDAAA